MPLLHVRDIQIHTRPALRCFRHEKFVASFIFWPKHAGKAQNPPPQLFRAVGATVVRARQNLERQLEEAGFQVEK